MIALLLSTVLGCNEYVVKQQPDPPVADPPGSDDPGDEGDAPDWTQCGEGYLGHYYNLTVDHPDIEPEGELLPVEDPDVFDWWDEDRLAFERYDASLDQGASCGDSEIGVPAGTGSLEGRLACDPTRCTGTRSRREPWEESATTTSVMAGPPTARACLARQTTGWSAADMACHTSPGGAEAAR